MASSKDKFLTLLYDDLLKVDLADLDFGFYRILKYRRDEVKAFFGQRLPEILAEAMQGQAADRTAQVRSRLASLTSSLETVAPTLGLAGAFTDGRLDERLADMPTGKDYRALAEELVHLEAAAGFSQTEEDRLYNHLYLFFSRYYADGDFMRQPRRGREGRYSVAYNGEDVHFHWRGRGSHYIKTTEELRSYRYRDGDWSVQFELVEASEEHDNVKGKTRYFFPLPERFEADPKARLARLPFIFRPLTAKEETHWKGNGSVQDQIAEAAAPQMRKRLVPGLDGDKLAQHVRRYARKHRIDYFVHPNPGHFLKAELDWYLKNEFLDVEAFTNPEGMTDKFIKFHALRQIGGLIIDFLDQVETFQAVLFEKRKFVLRADYLAPVRMLDPALWPEILKNAAQIAAWRDLFGLKGKVSDETLKAHPTLVVDTRHFDDAFKLRLLACYADIDEALDGVLVHAENYAALRTLEYRYRGRVKCIYIDPPYNTGKDDFLYKDEFSRHSTWLMMAEERLRLLVPMLDQSGVLFCSIDGNEYVYLHELLNNVFGRGNCVGTIAWKGATDNNPTRIQLEHEYIDCFVRDSETNDKIWKSPNIAAKELMLEEYRRLKDLCSDISEIQRGFRRFVKNNYETLQPLTHYDRVDEDGPYTGSRKVHNPGKEGYRYDVIHPNGRPCVQPARGYRFPPETMDKLLASGKVLFGDDETQIIQIKEYLKDYQGSLKGVLELDGRVGANAVESLFGSREVFKNPKPVELVSGLLAYVSSGNDFIADFFAGSGTTAQAVIQLNREDRAARRFLLADFGAYFDEILVERTMRVMYWPTWKQGKPVVVDAEEPGWIERSPRLLKILRLESFEDSLNALELPEERDARLAGQQDIFGDDYLLKYMLDFETEDSPVRLNTQALEHPFDYKLRIHGNDGLVEVPVDLVETFNLLMGLHVQRIHALADGKRPYRVVEALEDGRPVLAAWRDMAGFDPERDRAFLEGRFDLPAFAVVYVNGDSSIPNGRSLDGEFHRRMNERDEHFLQ